MNKYKNFHGDNTIPTTITTNVIITTGTSEDTAYISRRRIQQQKEIIQKEPSVEPKNVNTEKNIQQKINNCEDSFSTEITEQKSIEKSLNKLKNNNKIEIYQDMEKNSEFLQFMIYFL